VVNIRNLYLTTQIPGLFAWNFIALGDVILNKLINGIKFTTTLTLNSPHLCFWDEQISNKIIKLIKKNIPI
jgi:hypothetical protein